MTEIKKQTVNKSKLIGEVDKFVLGSITDNNIRVMHNSNTTTIPFNDSEKLLETSCLDSCDTMSSSSNPLETPTDDSDEKDLLLASMETTTTTSLRNSNTGISYSNSSKLSEVNDNIINTNNMDDVITTNNIKTPSSSGASSTASSSPGVAITSNTSDDDIRPADDITTTTTTTKNNNNNSHDQIMLATDIHKDAHAEFAGRRLTSFSEQETSLLNLNDREEDVLHTFMRLLSSKNSPSSSHTAVKFLMARKFDLVRAWGLYESHLHRRKRFQLDKCDPFSDPLKSELARHKFSFFGSKDKHGRALAVFNATKHHPKDCSALTVMQALTLHLDYATWDTATQRQGIILIYNMAGSGIKNLDYELAKQVLEFLQEGYPARLCRTYVLDAPLWFRATVRLLSPFVKKKTLERLTLISRSELIKQIPTSSLPDFLGGTMEFDYAHQLELVIKQWKAHPFAALSGPPEPSKPDRPSRPLKPPTPPTKKKIVVDIPPLTKRNSQGDTNSPKLSDASRSKSVEGIKGIDIEPFEITSNFKYELDELEIIVSEDKNKGKPTLPPKPTSNVMQKGVFTRIESVTDRQIPVPPTPFNHEQSTNPDDQFQRLIAVQAEGDYPMSRDHLREYIESRQEQGLGEEYFVIRNSNPDGSFTNSAIPYNIIKNRYRDVLAYDHSRVRLQKRIVENDWDPQDYINANHIDSFKSPNSFIMCQGPIPATMPDFWRMVWEQEVLVVVMVTRCVEGSRLKCAQYWPQLEDGPIKYGEIVVTPFQEEVSDGYMIRNFNINHVSESTGSRDITHFQYVAWPDYGVPENGEEFFSLLEAVDQSQMAGVSQYFSDSMDKFASSMGPPIVVHCSAGIGRSGTFCSIHSLIRQYRATGMVSVHATVRKLRTQRAYSIQAPEQYLFIYYSILEYMNRFPPGMQGIPISLPSIDANNYN